MKRFSKIFCVALIAIILGSLNQHWQLINTAFAVETAHDKIMKLCKDGTNTNVGSKLFNLTDKGIQSNISGAKVNDYNGTCYSNSVNFIAGFLWKIYNIKTPGKVTASDINDDVFFSTGIMGSIDTQILASKDINDSYSYAGQAYSALRLAIPDNAQFSDNEYIKTITEWLNNGGPEDVSPTGSGDRTEPATWAAPLVYADANADANMECADDDPNPPGFISCVSNLPLCLFRYINIGIIHLTTSIIRMGVNTMGWLMQPNNLWAPGISNNPAVIQAFGASVSVVNIVFSVVLVMMAIGTILNLKSYKINDLITKFIIVALLINFTLVIAGSILDLANYISLYFYNATLKSIQSGTLTDKWTEILTNKVCLSGAIASTGRMFVSIFINLLVFIAIAAAMFSVCGSLLKRGVMLMFLLIISPFAVICYLLPAKGMGQWWEKWKTSFLQQTFYGVYVSVGFYLGTIMLSALSISNQLSDEELSFASGIIKPILAAGYLIFIVLLADEVAGGSAKASITGATKFALGAAAGGAAAVAMKAKTAFTTNEGFSNLASKLNTTKGFGWAGKRMLEAKGNSLNQRTEAYKADDAIITTRTPESNAARLKALINSDKRDGKTVHEMAVIAKQLHDQKQWGLVDGDDKEHLTSKKFEGEMSYIYSDANIANGVISRDLKDGLKKADPKLFLRSDYIKEVTKDGIITEDIAQRAIDESNGDVGLANEKLKNNYKGNKNAEKSITDAGKKYVAGNTKILSQFARNAETAKPETLLDTILGEKNKEMKDMLVESAVKDPNRLKQIREQMIIAGTDEDKMSEFDKLAIDYVKNHLSDYSESQYNSLLSDTGTASLDLPDKEEWENAHNEKIKNNPATANKVYNEAYNANKTMDDAAINKATQDYNIAAQAYKTAAKGKVAAGAWNNLQEKQNLLNQLKADWKKNYNTDHP